MISLISAKLPATQSAIIEFSSWAVIKAVYRRPRGGEELVRLLLEEAKEKKNIAQTSGKLADSERCFGLWSSFLWEVVEVLLKLAWTKHIRAPFLLSSCLCLPFSFHFFSQSAIILCTEAAHLPFSSRACLPGPFRSLKPASLCCLTVVTHKICIRQI